MGLLYLCSQESRSIRFKRRFVCLDTHHWTHYGQCSGKINQTVEFFMTYRECECFGSWYYRSLWEKRSPLGNVSNSKCCFYVLLTLHHCIISQIHPTKCTVLFNIFIYFSSVHVLSSLGNVSNSKCCFYVLLNLHHCIILQIHPTKCTILFNIFIYFSSVHVSGIHVPIIRRKIAVSMRHWYLSLWKGVVLNYKGYYYIKYRVLPIGKISIKSLCKWYCSNDVFRNVYVSNCRTFLKLMIMLSFMLM
jgi:hypothetical protein